MTVNKVSDKSKQIAPILKELGHSERFTVCCLLAYTDEMSVGDLFTHVSISQSALSQHLARLRGAGIVCTRKESQTVFYRLTEDIREIILSLEFIYS